METKKRICMYLRKAAPWFVVVGLVLVAFVIGVCCSSITSSTRANRLEKILNTIRDDYLNAFSEDELYYGAAKGAVKSLKDPYTSFLTPNEAKEYFKQSTGEFVGIGIQCRLDQHKQVRILGVAPSGPADNAGLKRGDVILQIDGVNLTGLDMDSIINKIRGPKDKPVVLTVSRAEWAQPRSVKLIRREAVFPSVDCSAKDNGIVYLKLTQFNDFMMLGVDMCIGKHVNATTKGIILDLRDNPGGSLEAARQLASEWTPKNDMLLYTLKSRHGKDIVGVSSGDHLFAGIKTVVLVNNGSASASEFISGVLQDYKLATIVGEKTHGKGVGQNIKVFSDGSMLILVSFKWYTPLGRNIHQVGITPDIQMSVDPDKLDWNADPVLDKALEFLSQK